MATVRGRGGQCLPRECVVLNKPQNMQQVNLYLPELRPKKEWLTARTTGVIALGFIAMMWLGVLLSSHRLELRAQQLERMETYRQQALLRIQDIRSRARPGVSAELDEQLANIIAAIATREKLAAIMRGQELGNQQGFSAALEGLARQSMPSISLEHFRFSAGGARVELEF